MTNVKFNKNRVAKGVATVLTGIGSGAIWAAGAIAARNTAYHPLIKAVYYVGSLTTGCLLQRVTQNEAEKLIDEIWPEDEANVEIQFDTEIHEMGS